MRRRKYIAAMGSLAAGGAAALGTGAVETISTDRGLSVDVAGDASAYLGIQPNDQSQFVQVGNNSKLVSLDFATNSGNNGQGVNNEGSTEARPAFTLRNQGNRDMYVAILNPLRNNNIKKGETNNTGFAGNVNVPAGIDFQFAASTKVPRYPNDEVGLIDRNGAPQSSNNFGAPSDPRTISRRAGASSSYNVVDLNDTGYIEIPTGKSVPITTRVVTDGFDVKNDAVPNTRFIVNATTDESKLKLSGKGRENITSKINLDGNRY
jgi:hypothetical protein